MSVAEQLRKTPRGRLKYDRQALCLRSIEGVLEEIRSGMNAMQVRLDSPCSYTSPPSFGLRAQPDSDSDSPLIPRTVRMVDRRPDSDSDSPLISRTVRMVDRRPDSDSDSPLIPRTVRMVDRRPGGGAARLETGRPADRPLPLLTVTTDLSSAPTARTVHVSSAPRTLPAPAPAVPDPEAEGPGSGLADTSPEAAVPVCVTPRAGHPSTPFTPRTYDALLHRLEQRHLEEAKREARVRLATAESTVEELRRQHQLKLQQLAADQQLRRLAEHEQRGLLRQQSEQLLRQKHEHIELARQRRAKDVSERVQAAVERKQADEEARQRTVRRRRQLDQMVAAQKQLRATVTHVVSKIKSCVDRPQLQAGPAAGHVETLQRLLVRMDSLVGAAATDAETAVVEADSVVQQAARLAVLVSEKIDEINTGAAAAAASEGKAVPVSPAGRSVADVSKAAAPSADPAAVTQPPVPAELSSSALDGSRLFYEELQQKLAQFRARFADLLSDPRMKQFKFDCQKAVNTPINAISPVSTVHLRDKLDKLRSLLRGQQVPVAGQGHVTASAHPHGVDFCLDLVAKKFVRQGEDVVSSKPEAAFALAAVLCALQVEFPELTELTLGHLQARCPYLVPLYPPQLDGDTDETYYRKLGYEYTDGTVERQDKFLKRMSGVMRLHAALLISQPPQSARGAVKPLGLAHAWHWMASVVNLEPRADITATLVHDMLDVAGSALAAAYGTQFAKLARLLHAKYLVVVRAVTPEGCGGPVVRLEERLRDIITTGRVPAPSGQLKLYGW